jgi:hypothetical protein
MGVVRADTLLQSSVEVVRACGYPTTILHQAQAHMKQTSRLRHEAQGPPTPPDIFTRIVSGKSVMIPLRKVFEISNTILYGDPHKRV